MPKYAMAIVVDAATPEKALDFASDELARSYRRWDPDATCIFIGTPVEIEDSEQYDSTQACQAIMAE